MDEKTAEYHELRYEYDKTVSRKMKRRRDALIAVEQELEAADTADLQELATKMHDLYNRGMGKMTLRKAVRQYGSPKFLELWNAAPYTEPSSTAGVQADSSYVFLSENIIEVNRRGWDWTGVEEETLQFTVVWSEAQNRHIATWPEGSAPHAMFNMRNMVDLRDIINSEENRG